jgi:hypothetical protein
MSSGYESKALRATEGERRFALNLFYRGQRPMTLHGAETGNMYRFSESQRVQPVDTKDAMILLASPLFRLAR